MRTRNVLAWDLGTSGAKVGIVTPDGDVLATEFEPTERLLLPDGGAEQRPEDWWRALGTATERLLARELVPRASIGAVGTTAQWSGTVAIGAGGEPLMNALIWMDSRGARYARALTSGLIRVSGYAPLKLARWVRLTGGAPVHSGKDSIAHILWIKNERPDVYERTHKFLEPKDYLTFRLTGRITATFDSIALHWVTDNRDAADVRYDAGLLELTGVDREKLPDLCRASDILGRLTRENCERFGLSRDVIVTASAPDVHSAAIGAGTTRDREAHLYVGTSSWFACHVPEKKTDVLHNMAALPAAIPNRYLLLSEQENAGGCLVHLRDKLFFANDELTTTPAPADVYQAFDRLASTSPPGSRKLLFFPWLYGERTPVEDPHLRGGLFNYSLLHDRADVVRSVLEGVALNARWLFQHVEAFSGGSLAELRFIGGGAESALWAQIFADVLDRPILKVMKPQASNLRGAALIAFVALGLFDFVDVPSRVRVESRFEPRDEHRALYTELFQEFTTFHEKNRAAFARLNRRAEG